MVEQLSETVCTSLRSRPLRSWTTRRSARSTLWRQPSARSPGTARADRHHLHELSAPRGQHHGVSSAAQISKVIGPTRNRSIVGSSDPALPGSSPPVTEGSPPCHTSADTDHGAAVSAERPEVRAGPPSSPVARPQLPARDHELHDLRQVQQPGQMPGIPRVGLRPKPAGRCSFDGAATRHRTRPRQTPAPARTRSTLPHRSPPPGPAGPAPSRSPWPAPEPGAARTPPRSARAAHTPPATGHVRQGPHSSAHWSPRPTSPSQAYSPPDPARSPQSRPLLHTRPRSRRRGAGQGAAPTAQRGRTTLTCDERRATTILTPRRNTTAHSV